MYNLSKESLQSTLSFCGMAVRLVKVCVITTEKPLPDPFPLAENFCYDVEYLRAQITEKYPFFQR